jgi:hypothetical protein
MKASDNSAEALNQLKEGVDTSWTLFPAKVALMGGAIAGGVGLVGGFLTSAIASVGAGTIVYGAAKLGQSMAKFKLSNVEGEGASKREENGPD